MNDQDELQIKEAVYLQELEAVKEGTKFCWSKVWIGVMKIITFFGTYVYAIYTWKIIQVINAVLHSNGHTIELAGSPLIIVLSVGWVVATVCLILNLQKAISVQIEKMEVKVNAEAKLSKNINVDAAEVVKAVRG